VQASCRKTHPLNSWMPERVQTGKSQRPVAPETLPLSLGSQRLRPHLLTVNFDWIGHVVLILSALEGTTRTDAKKCRSNLTIPLAGGPCPSLSKGIDAGLSRAGQDRGRKAASFEPAIRGLLRRGLETLKMKSTRTYRSIHHRQPATRR
jgi:hypothetical protein